MTTVAVVSPGYFGLPFVVEFGEFSSTIAVDKAGRRRPGTDPSRKISQADMRSATHAEYTSNAADLIAADVLIAAVPTPVNDEFVHDPQAYRADAVHEYGVELKAWDGLPRAHAIVARSRR